MANSPKTPTPPVTLKDAFAQAWHRCTALWPLFLVQAAYLVLQYATLVLCLLIVFGPLFKELMSQDPAALQDPEAVGAWLGERVVSQFQDPAWLAICGGLAFLYMVWWFLLATLWDGGVFTTCRRHLRGGIPFHAGEFFREAFRLFGPMLLLQFLLIGLGLLLTAVFGAVTLLVVGLLALTQFNTAFVVVACLVPGIPLLLLFIFLVMVLAAYSLVAKARLADGNGPWEALRTGWRRFRADQWRVGIGLILAFAVYMMVSFSVSLAFSVLEAIPVVGVVFTFSDILISVALAVVLAVYLPSLTVTYLGPGGEEA